MNQARRRNSLWLLLLFSAITLNGCSHLSGKDAVVRNYNNDYRYAKSLPPLKMPPGAELADVNSLYPIPNNNSLAYAGAPSLIPPGNPGSAKSSNRVIKAAKSAGAAKTPY